MNNLYDYSPQKEYDSHSLAPVQQYLLNDLIFQVEERINEECDIENGPYHYRYHLTLEVTFHCKFHTSDLVLEEYQCFFPILG